MTTETTPQNAPLAGHRAALVAVAADLWVGCDIPPDLGNEYMRGQVELIVYGTMTAEEADMGDADVTKEEVTADIRERIAATNERIAAMNARAAEANRRKKAKEIAERIARPYVNKGERLIAVQAAHAAALAGLEARP